jgi:hypothetical protein
MIQNIEGSNWKKIIQLKEWYKILRDAIKKIIQLRE